MLRSIGKESGESVESVSSEEEKGRKDLQKRKVTIKRKKADVSRYFTL